MQWIKASSIENDNLNLPDGLRPHVIRFGENYYQIGQTNDVRDLYENGWNDIHWAYLDEIESPSPDGWVGSNDFAIQLLKELVSSTEDVGDDIASIQYKAKQFLKGRK